MWEQSWSWGMPMRSKEVIQKTYGKETVLFDEAAKLSQEKSRGFVTT